MADRTIATITGTMLTPGVSGNGNLYTAGMIKKAVARMQGRLSDPTSLPVVMRSHHGAGDDSTRIVGRITSVRVDETGAAKYSAALYDTSQGRDIAALVTGNTPALRSVSIHGWFLGPVKRVDHGGETVETAEDLEVNAVDFTANPGVRQALLDLPSASTNESIAERTPIAESVDATVTAVTDPAPEPSVIEAHPIKTKSDLRKAIRAVGKGGADTIREHIIGRAKSLSLTSMIPDAWNTDGSLKERTTRFGEIREFAQGPTGQSGFCIDAFNGPVSVTVRSCDIDPSGLRVVAAAAMSAAVDALQALDPDMDADIDVPGDAADDTDGDMGKGKKKAKEAVESVEDPADEALRAHVGALVEQGLQPGEIVPAAPTTETTPTVGVSTNTEEVPAVSEATQDKAAESTAAAPTGRTLSDDDIKALGALFAGAVKEAVKAVAPVAETAPTKAKAETSESAPAAPTAESTPKAEKKAARKALKESVDGVKAELQEAFDAKLAEERTKLRDELREELRGEVSRKGYRVHENDGDADKAPTGDELWDKRAEVWNQFIPGGPAQPAQDADAAA